MVRLVVWRVVAHGGGWLCGVVVAHCGVKVRVGARAKHVLVGISRVEAQFLQFLCSFLDTMLEIRALSHTMAPPYTLPTPDLPVDLPPFDHTRAASNNASTLPFSSVRIL